jgi:hypothetical protein
VSVPSRRSCWSTIPVTAAESIEHFCLSGAKRGCQSPSYLSFIAGSPNRIHVFCTSGAEISFFAATAASPTVIDPPPLQRLDHGLVQRGLGADSVNPLDAQTPPRRRIG